LSFILKILAGPDRGKVYTFDRVEITIGRTMDNDVVLPDPGISRQHMSIRDKGGAYILKDLGSSNGTKLNGKLVKEEVLRPGDVIVAGGAQVKFEGPAEGAPVKKARPAAKRPAKGARARSKNPPSRQQRAGARQARRPAAQRKAAASSGARGAAVAPSPAGEEKKPVIRSKGARVKTDPKARPKEASQESPQARKRGTRGRARGKRRGRGAKPNKVQQIVQNLVTWFKGLDKKIQIALIACFALLVVLVGIKAIKGTKRIVQQVTDHSNELFAAGYLDENGYLASFGVGPVTVYCRDTAAFKFKYANGRATVLFAVAGIDHKQEVDIQLNGMHIENATVTMDKWSEPILLNLPRKHLLENEENKLSFVNTINYNNPDAEEEWAVKVETIKETPLPSPDRQAAKHSFEIAKDRYRTKDVAPQNLYQALENFKKARDYLELLPEETRPEIYIEADEMVIKIEKEIEKRFRDLMFNAERARKYGDHPKAKELFHKAMLTFPNQEDPRHVRAREKYEEYK